MHISNRGSRYAPTIVLLLALAPQLLWAGEGKIRRSPNAVKDEYIVVLNDNTKRDDVPGIAAGLARQYDGKLERVWQDALKGFFVRMSEGRARGLSHHPDVKYIEENAEMYLSATVPTNVDPACTPGPGVTCTTTDNRLWHLDMIDQNAAVGTKDYSYCETGSGVYVYLIDTGVMRAHREFNNDANKILNGYDATGDPADFPAWDPCSGPGFETQGPDGQVNSSKIRGNNSHGTGVASLVAGLNVGIARGAKVVPVKVMPCARYGARKLNSSTPNTWYDTNETVQANGTYYTVTAGGFTGSTATYPHTNWPWPPNPLCCQTWGDVQLAYLGGLPSDMTVQMTIEGLDWILRPVGSGGNPNPKSPAVVSLSTYRVVGEDGVTNVPSGSAYSLEEAIGNLLKYNNGHGITVVASANNQDGNACDTSPGRMSRGNTANPNDPDTPYKVITAGGTMLRNNPDSNPAATGGLAGDPGEPQYDATKATRLARWRCHAGDSDICSGNIYGTPPATTPNPITARSAYIGTTLGSNGGQCVTLFAPAKNIPVANLHGLDTYRDSRATGGFASGTSWSAPIVAGIAARILQNNTTFDVDQVYDALMARTAPDLDTQELNPPNVTGTPNAVLRLTPVVVQPLPTTMPLASGSATITVSASGATGLTYELYQVNGAFDVATWGKGAENSVKIAGPQSSSTFTVSPTQATSYFARARSSCGTADTNITTVIDLAAPAGVIATANGSTVTIQWNLVSGATGYEVWRKVSSAAWQLAQTVTSGTQSSTTDVPGAPNAVVLYRVIARSGAASSPPSNNDVAYAAFFTDDALGTPTGIKAEHITELRRAVNTLRDISSAGAVYTSTDIDPNELRADPIDDGDFTTLMAALTTARSLAGLPAPSAGTTPAAPNAILSTQINDLRNGLR
jgi:Subtilase family/Peptidase inhibitor I9